MTHYRALARFLLWGGSLLPLAIISSAVQATPLPDPSNPDAEFKTEVSVDHTSAVISPLPPSSSGLDSPPPAMDPAIASGGETPDFSPLAGQVADALEAPSGDSADALQGSAAAALEPVFAATTQSDPAAALEIDSRPLAQIRTAPDGDGWEYVLTPYLFLPFNINATVNVAGVEQSASIGLGDLFNLDRVLAAALRFEARNPQYGFFGDLSYVYAREGRSLTNFPLPQVVTDPLSLVSGVPVPPGTPASVTATATSRTTTLDLGGFYRVVDQTLGENATYPRLLVDPLAGLRLIFLSGSVDFTDIAVGPVPLGARSLSQSATLVQPLLGAQASLELSERWAVGLRGDIAGFGIGADENLSWNILLGTRYSFNDTLALQLAYRFTELRYREGQGTDSFGLAQSQNGLWVGLDIGL